MSAVPFLRDLTVVLLAAAAALLAVRRLKQPPVLGYIAAGVLVAPLVGDRATLEALSEVGVVFLLFALGVEFNLRRLAAVGARALVAAGVEAAAVMALAHAAGPWLGLSALGSLLLGGVLALASTAIVARALLSRAGGGSWTELASGVLIAEDILAVALLAFYASAGSLGGDPVAAVFTQLARFGMLATLILVSGLLVLPRVLRLVERSGLKEVRTLVIVGTCFALALLTSELGYSAALGAFLAGAMMSESAAATRLRETAEPFKDVFGSVFFVSVGMLLDVSWLRAHAGLALGLSAAALAARLAANALAFAVVGEDARASLRAAAARLPIGEFSFILARLGDAQGLTPFPLFPLSVLVCVLSAFAGGAIHERWAAEPARAERWVPAALGHLLDEYRGALRRLALPRQARAVWELIRPSVIQIALNLLGLSGVFLLVGRFKERFPPEAALPGAAWMAAALGTLPFLMALWRKAQAVTLVLLEAATARPGEDRPPAEARPGLTRLVLAAATGAVAWWYVDLSLPLLPPGRAALAPLALIALSGLLLWRGANRLYARMQASLRETLSRADAEPSAGAAVVSYLVEQEDDVRVTTVRMTTQAPAGGRSLRELELRSVTGATIVQVNREGTVTVAPPASLRLRPGDELVVVGTADQVAAARRLLVG